MLTNLNIPPNILFSIAIFLFTGTALAQEEPQYIVEVLSPAIPLYDNDLNETEKIKKNTFKKSFATHTTDSGEEVKGLAILEIGDPDVMGLELVKVEVPGHSAAWIEISKVEVWPAKQIICPEGALSKEERTTFGGSVGFGGCNEK